MSTFQTVTPSMQQLDPSKRVNYTFGLVLGVDEFLQEQTYLIEKDRSQYRLAHGSGTVCGLQMRIVEGVNLEVRVSPGVAINPTGQEIHVEQEMCARLNDWLTNNKDALQAVFGTPPLSVPLCVVLCYRECPSDMVPVPGEPCRTQQDSVAASRITETFQLKLCLNIAQIASPPMGSPAIDNSLLSGLCYRPTQVEEDEIRAFGQLLRRIEITDSATVFLTQDELVYLVRQLATSAGAPLTSPPLGSPPVSSPPWDNPTLFLHPNDASDFLRAAFRVWITEVRPALAALAGANDCGSSEQCVLLAELSVPVSPIWMVSGTVEVDETHRPYLLPSRLLQECLLSGGLGGGSAVSVHGSFTVAAGTFSISPGGNATAVGPVFNGLTATAAGAPPGVYLLQWSGSPGYVMPGGGSPDHNYIVLGTPINRNPPAVPLIFEIVQFVGNGILVRVCDTSGAAKATGFTVEIKELTGMMQGT